LELKKNINIIKTKYYPQVMDKSFQEKDWKECGSKIKLCIKIVCDNINFLKNAVENSQDPNSRTIEIIKENFPDIEKIEPLISDMNDKINYCKFDQMEEKEEKEEEEKDENQIKSQILIQDLYKNKEILEKRREDLETVYRTSAQIKDLTDIMAKQLNEQGEILDNVEENVITAEDNAKKANVEITEAEELSRGNRKMMSCLIVIVLISIAGITAILLSLIFG
jgi:hypothetical protein